MLPIMFRSDFKLKRNEPSLPEVSFENSDYLEQTASGWASRLTKYMLYPEKGQRKEDTSKTMSWFIPHFNWP